MQVQVGKAAVIVLPSPKTTTLPGKAATGEGKNQKPGLFLEKHTLVKKKKPKTRPLPGKAPVVKKKAALSDNSFTT